MTDEQLTRLMSQLGAGLRENVKPPDRWTMRLVNLGPEHEHEHKVIEVDFERTVGDRRFGKVEIVTPELLTQSVLSIDAIAWMMVGRWHHEVDEAGSGSPVH